MSTHTQCDRCYVKVFPRADRKLQVGGDLVALDLCENCLRDFNTWLFRRIPTPPPSAPQG